MERRDGKSRNHPVPDPVERMEYVRQVWDMRRDHVPYNEICEKLDIGRATAHKYFKLALGLAAPRVTDEERELAIEQIEAHLHKANQLYAQTTDIDIRLKILMTMDRLLKSKRDLMGLDSAKKFEVKATVQSELDGEIEALNDELGRLNAGREQKTQDLLNSRRKGFRAK